MVNYMGNWHLIAYCHLRREWRDFLLGRMTNCHMTATPFQIRPKDAWQPLLQDTFGIFQGKRKFNVVLRFTPERSRWVKDEVWHEAQSEVVEADGALIRTLPASHEAEIMMEILKHGSQVEVLEPDWLREMVREEIRASAKNYQ